MTERIKRFVFTYSLREARARIRNLTDDYDSDEKYSYVILSLIHSIVLDDYECEGLNEVVYEMTGIGIPEPQAFQMCNDVVDLIINQLTNVIPDFDNQRYSNNYRYELKENSDVKLIIEADAYCSGVLNR